MITGTRSPIDRWEVVEEVDLESSYNFAEYLHFETYIGFDTLESMLTNNQIFYNYDPKKWEQLN